MTFGFHIQDGEIKPEPYEEKYLIEIFEMWLQGKLHREIAEYLTEQKVHFQPDKNTWSRSRVSKILGDERYFANEHLNIFPEELLKRIMDKNENKESPKPPPPEPESVEFLKGRIICKCCGETYRRNIISKGKNKRHVWRCKNKCQIGSGYTDNEIENRIVRLVNELITDIDNVTFKNKNSKILKFKTSKLQNDINRELDYADVNTDKVKKLIYECAADKLETLSDREIELEDVRIRKRLETKEQLNTFNTDFIKTIIKEIHIKSDENIISIILKNEYIREEQRE